MALLALASAGCGSRTGSYDPQPSKPVDAVTVGPGVESNLFPLKEGNQWTYTVSTAAQVGDRRGTGAGEMTFKVVKVTPKDDGVVAQIEVRTDSSESKPEMQVWEVNRRGIFQSAVGTPSIPYDPPQVVVQFPIEADKKFAWKGKGAIPAGGVGELQMESKMLAPQEVDGETERFSAIPVHSEGTFGAGDSKGRMASVSYWSPNVGLVRYRHEVITNNKAEILTLKLKARTLR